MMKEGSVFFNAGAIRLEGLMGAAGTVKGVVVTHPHSQMGGSMANNVVSAMVAAFHEREYRTLRFNFRGVGRSGGFFDNGIGEQDDVAAACAALRETGATELILSGYSFGAWVNARLLGSQGGDFSDVIVVSPPIDFMEFDFSPLAGRCGLIICGDRDQFCPLGPLKEAAGGVGARLEIIRGADHFYFGHERAICECLSDYLENSAPAH